MDLGLSQRGVRGTNRWTVASLLAKEFWGKKSMLFSLCSYAGHCSANSEMCNFNQGCSVNFTAATITCKVNFKVKVYRWITWELTVVMWDNMLCFCNLGVLKSQKWWAVISDLAGVPLLGPWISCNSGLEIKINFLRIWNRVFTLWRWLTLFSCFLIVQLMDLSEQNFTGNTYMGQDLY